MRRLPRPQVATKRRLSILLLLCVGISVFGPLVIVVARSFWQEGVVGLDAYRDLFASRTFTRALWNTFLFVAVSVPISVVLGLGLALSASRISSPIVRFLPLVSLLIPPLIGAMGWVFLLGPRTGLINVAIRAALGDNSGSGPLNIYSIPGVLFASIVYTIPFTYLLCLAALDNVDSSMEEAARTSGAGPLSALRGIVVPIIRPGLSSAILLTTLVTLTEFSVPLIIGRPFGFWVLTMEIWRSIRGQYPSDYAAATAIGTMLLFVAIIGTYLQRRVLSNRSFATVTGKGRRRPVELAGRARKLALGALVGYISLTVVLPILAIFFVSLLPYWSSSPTLEQFSLDNYSAVVSDSRLIRAAGNSAILAIVAATITVAVTAVGAYAIVRARDAVTSALDYAFVLPSGMPHTVLGLGFLLFFLFGPLPIYGTLVALAFAYVILFLPHASRTSISAMHQVAPELEEASYVSGAAWLKTMRRITFPLLAPGLRAGWVFVFILAFRELSASILLTTSKNNVISPIMVTIYENGQLTFLAAVAVMVVLFNSLIVFGVGRSRQGRQ